MFRRSRNPWTDTNVSLSELLRFEAACSSASTASPAPASTTCHPKGSFVSFLGSSPKGRASIKHVGEALQEARYVIESVICDPNFEGLVLGCIEADFYNQILVGKLLTRTTNSTFFSWPNFSFFSLSPCPFSQSSFRTDGYSNEYLIAKIGVDTEENEPSKVFWFYLIFIPRSDFIFI